MIQDRVVLDVGGTTFVTTKKTLSAWTHYFDSSTTKSNEPIVVDADPDAFAVLLSFMRHGSVDSCKITNAVLQQAIQFQVEGFLTFCKNVDRVVLNLRGTCVETSKALLIQHSTFFQQQFSSSWALELNPFINQDADAFCVCLEFMTRGHIESSKLTNQVLELAEFLGIQQLVDAVKCKTCWMGSDERSLDKFDEEHDSLSSAIASSSKRGAPLIQQDFSPPPTLEYVSVYLHKKSSSARTSLRLPFRACVYGNVSPELLRMGDTINVLNRLAREGYALADESLQTSWNKDKNSQEVPGLGRILAHVLFVKQSNATASRQDSVQSCIIDDDSATLSSSSDIEPREFVALLRPFDEVHSQNAVRLAIPSSDSAPTYWMGSQLRDAPDPSYHGAVAWLSNHGFYNQEGILTRAFSSALEELTKDESGWASVLVFSKPITPGQVTLPVHDTDTLPTVIESVSMTSSITDNMSLENGHH